MRQLGRALVLLLQGGAHGRQGVGFELAHQLADELHLAPFALEIRDAAGVGQRVAKLLGHVEAVHQVGAQRQQLLAEFLKFRALAFELGPAGFGGALELALELQVEFAAFGNELAADVIAFFGFAGHGRAGSADRGDGKYHSRHHEQTPLPRSGPCSRPSRAGLQLQPRFF
jgi:hypothetical protein